MKILSKIALLLSLIAVIQPVFGQTNTAPKSLVSTENGHLYAKTDNLIRIVAQQEEPVSIRQLSATLQAYDGKKHPIAISERTGCFIIHPDTVGLIEIKINLGDTEETKALRVIPMKVVGLLSKYEANTNKKIGINEFKAQYGISAVIICCGFDARCTVLGFEAIRITANNIAERTVNQGGKFTEKTRKIILKAASGDLFIFRNIRYRCPGSEPLRLEDMIFEIE
ncbi:MAG TPA: GldM family protein [Flavilitoribacter sp.]|nr:GldM family protein [Flavilitoribacter sp.]HMQ86815.1 GldM family protein [Flavilitoribacter sp.]